jgi:hypothetical protein
VKTAHALVVELDAVSFFTANGDRSGKLFVRAASIRAIKNLQSDQGHGNRSKNAQSRCRAPDLVPLLD